MALIREETGGNSWEYEEANGSEGDIICAAERAEWERSAAFDNAAIINGKNVRNVVKKKEMMLQLKVNLRFCGDDKISHIILYYFIAAGETYSSILYLLFEHISAKCKFARLWPLTTTTTTVK